MEGWRADEISEEDRDDEVEMKRRGEEEETDKKMEGVSRRKK